MQTKKIVITGGPGTGKTSVIQELENQGFKCLPEISREITLEAQKEGVSQLFLRDPLLFSKKLMKGRCNQFYEAEKANANLVFLDRGIPDVVAYLEYVNAVYPSTFHQFCEELKYTSVFLLPPWEGIYKSDNERYENFEEATEIHEFLSLTYKKYGYRLLEVPKDTIENRVDFIISKAERLWKPLH